MKSRNVYEAIVHDVLTSEPMRFDWERPLIQILFQNRSYASGDHDIFHSVRVKRLAYRISEANPADDEVLTAAAYLHDIASDTDRFNHIPLALEQAAEVLPVVGFPQVKLPVVLQCIELHEDYNWAGRQNYSGLPPEVLIFQDADRLDALGAIGIARSFSFSAVHHLPMWLPAVKPDATFDPQILSRTTINHFQEKILKLGDIFNTALARDMARERTAFVEQFVNRFMAEWNAIDDVATRSGD